MNNLWLNSCIAAAGDAEITSMGTELYVQLEISPPLSCGSKGGLRLSQQLWQTIVTQGFSLLIKKSTILMDLI
jgi:hypothetical protein